MSTQITTKRLTTVDLMKMKTAGKKIVCLTAYDISGARLCDEAQVDVILVGDSMNTVVYGESDTLSITVQDMIRPTRAVVKGSARAFVVADMPFMSYQSSETDALVNASRFMKECGAQAVKVEGGKELENTIKRLVQAGIPVMAHIGLTPQRVHAMGGYRMHGKTNVEAEILLEDARAVERAGAFSVVLECVDPTVSNEITKTLSIPTIGIGSGNGTDGQILVFHDLVGMTDGHTPKFVVPTANIRPLVKTAIELYVSRTKEQSS